MAVNRSGVRYQPDGRPPPALAVGLGLQLAALNLAAIRLIPTVVMRAAGESEAYVSWAVLWAISCPTCRPAARRRQRRSARWRPWW